MKRRPAHTRPCHRLPRGQSTAVWRITGGAPACWACDLHRLPRAAEATTGHTIQLGRAEGSLRDCDWQPSALPDGQYVVPTNLAACMSAGALCTPSNGLRLHSPKCLRGCYVLVHVTRVPGIRASHATTTCISASDAPSSGNDMRPARLSRRAPPLPYRPDRGVANTSCDPRRDNRFSRYSGIGTTCSGFV